MIVNNVEQHLLRNVLEHFLVHGTFPEVQRFRLDHEDDRQMIDALVNRGFLRFDRSFRGQEQLYRLTLKGLQACDNEAARQQIEDCNILLRELKVCYRELPNKVWSVTELAQRVQDDPQDLMRSLSLLSEFPIWAHLGQDQRTGLINSVQLSEPVLDAELIGVAGDEANRSERELIDSAVRIQRIEVAGYRPFAKFSADPKNLTVVIGANASGKSSLFDFLRFLSFAASNPLPPEIDPRSAGKRVFHSGGSERISFAVVVDLGQRKPVRYEAEIHGPVGRPIVSRERLATTEPLSPTQRQPFVFLDFQGGTGVIRDQQERKLKRPEWTVQSNELALRRALDPTLVTISRFQTFVSSWRFYSGFDVSVSGAIRRPVPTEPNPTLAEDGANLSAVLFSLMSEHVDAWQELETQLRSAIPGFLSLNVKAQGGPGTVMGIWRESGVRDELTLADLSDGTVRLLCWAALCFSNSMVPFVCIDEPELGLHPRVLPALAGLFRFASARTQMLIATHSPYFLSQFSLDEIAVMRKEKGQAVFVRPDTNAALRREVQELGNEVLAKMHISDELEARP